MSCGSVNAPPPSDTWPRGAPRMTDVTVLIGCAISTTASHSIVAPTRRNEAVSVPGAFCCPPAQVNPSHVSVSASSVPVACIFVRSRPYVFSSVNTRKPNRYAPNTTDGSGKSKLNFMKPRPRGGMKISLVDERSTMLPGSRGDAAGAGGADGVGVVGGSTGVTSGAARCSASGDTSAPALAAPTVLSQSRRETGSLMNAFLACWGFSRRVGSASGAAARPMRPTPTPRIRTPLLAIPDSMDIVSDIKTLRQTGPTQRGKPCRFPAAPS